VRRPQPRLGQRPGDENQCRVVAYTSTKNVAIGCLMIHARGGERSVLAACSVCSAMIASPLNNDIMGQHHPYVQGPCMASGQASALRPGGGSGRAGSSPRRQ
jgi:hypothetical protein